MPNLIVCCDGTWNAPDNKDDGILAPTNVFKLFNCVDDSAPSQQQSRYQSGVGTGGLIDKIVGGAFGFGLSEDIRDCYQWICDKYQPGDQLYLFGFSRGAYTARSLAGLICKLGIAKLNGIDEPEKHIAKIYKQGYRKDQPLNSALFHPNSKKVKFIGAWDTVGALGIPNDKIIANIFDIPKNYQFHDTKLHENVDYARHAIAIDEMRGSFSPTLWDQPNDQEGRVKQVWFPGVHSDVGGGYKENGLSECALKWMLDEAQDKGLICNSNLTEQVTPNPYDLKHESHVGLMKVLVTAPRNIPDLDKANNLAEAIALRREKPPITQLAYRPTTQLNSGESMTTDIYAKQQWNWIGLYIEEGVNYTFTASGEWYDDKIATGAKGANDGNFQVGEILHIAGSIMGKFEKLWGKITGSKQANAFGSKRIEKYEWFALVGAISDSGNPGKDGTHDPLTFFNIGEERRLKANSSGYLYCFANDAWGFYANNRGYLTLEIKKEQEK